MAVPHPTPANEAALHLALAKALHEADHDDLTGLLNRRGLRRRLTDLGQAQVAVVMLDLDGLKHINDTGGHGAGDAALTRAGGALAACVRPHDLLARWGGDEFLAVLVGDHRIGPTPETVAVRFARAVDNSLPAGQSVRLSLGLATGPAADFTRLLDEADAHLRRSKQGMR